MNSSGYHSATRLKKCEIYLKSHM